MKSANSEKPVEEKSISYADFEPNNGGTFKSCPAETTFNFDVCQLILKKLQSHRAAWPFKQPVDPVAQNVPNYFEIIKYPMDLATISKKIKAKLYNNDA